MSTPSSFEPRRSSQWQNSFTSYPYARRVPSESAGESRKRAAALWASTVVCSTPDVRSLRLNRQCWPVPHRTKVWVALGTVYLIWGSTYLGIELTGETIPPLFAVGVRFLAAAALMLAFTWWQRGGSVLRVRRAELASCVLIGALLPGANAVLFVAERHVATGLAALIIGAVPLWIVLMRTLSGDRPP